jgi:hypothetical protein
MGKKPDQIEQDIRAQREHITQRMAELERRVQDDMQSIQAEARDRANTAVEEAKGKVDQARGTLRIDNLKDLMGEHTVSTMASALGVGVVLGVVSESVLGNGHRNGTSARSGSRSDYREGYSRDGGDGNGSGLGGILASIIGPAASTAQEELQDLVREGFAAMKEQVQQVKPGKSDQDVLVKNRDVGVE